MLDQATASAPGKINLFFAVGPLLPDGFHSVASVYQALDLREAVSVAPSSQWNVSVSGALSDEQIASVPTGEDNLVVRAVKLVAKLAGLPEAAAVSELAIYKNVPVAGGMGGGSADAAAAMVAANELWASGLSMAQMTEAAVELGADVPFSLMGETAIGLGRGEKLTLVDQVAPLHWVLVVADRGLSTPAVYKRLDELRSARGEDPTKVDEAAVPAEFISAVQSGDVARVAKAIKNDLQEAALDLMPELADTIAAGIAAGALAGMVSGSGPTVALLAEDEESAERIANILAFQGLEAIAATGPAAGATLAAN